MADLVIDLDDAVIERLRLRAEARNVSLEDFLRDIIHEAARPTREELWAGADRLRAKFGPMPDDPTDLTCEDRDSR